MLTSVWSIPFFFSQMSCNENMSSIVLQHTDKADIAGTRVHNDLDLMGCALRARWICQWRSLNVKKIWLQPQPLFWEDHWLGGTSIRSIVRAVDLRHGSFALGDS